MIISAMLRYSQIPFCLDCQSLKLNKSLYTLSSLRYHSIATGTRLIPFPFWALGSWLHRVKQRDAGTMQTRDQILLLPLMPSLEKVSTSPWDQFSSSVVFLSQYSLRIYHKPHKWGFRLPCESKHWAWEELLVRQMLEQTQAAFDLVPRPLSYVDSGMGSCDNETRSGM